jgi:hypothetical protein
MMHHHGKEDHQQWSQEVRIGRVEVGEDPKE